MSRYSAFLYTAGCFDFEYIFKVAKSDDIVLASQMQPLARQEAKKRYRHPGRVSGGELIWNLIKNYQINMSC